MPKKETNQDRQAALKQKHTAPFSAPESPPGENDPPIIVSGGSVVITSKFELTPGRTSDGMYTYTTDKVKVKKIRTTGRRAEDDEPKDNGFFEIRLFDRWP